MTIRMGAVRPAVGLMASLLCFASGCSDTTDPDDGSSPGAGGSGGEGGADGAPMPTGPLTCADVDRSQEAMAPPLAGEDGGDEITLSGVYRIDSRFIYDGGQTVTIEPGTIFLMDTDARIYFGWRSDPATVYADGTEEAPILFCGTSEGPGSWLDIQLLTGTTTDSYLEHVRLEDAGGSESANLSAALLSTVPARLSHVTVTGSSVGGMELEGLDSESAMLESTGNEGVSLILRGESAISNLPEGVYTGNGEDVALIYETSNTNAHFHDRGIPYRQMEERVVYGVAGGDLTSITLDAGVTYEFCQDCFMYVGWRNDPGAIYAQGTEDDPVVFTSSRDTPEPGDWNGISLLGGTRSDSLIEYTEFLYGGKSDGAALTINYGAGTIKNSTFAYSAGYGIWIENEEAGLELSDNTFTDNMDDIGPK